MSHMMVSASHDLVNASHDHTVLYSPRQLMASTLMNSAALMVGTSMHN